MLYFLCFSFLMEMELANSNGANDTGQHDPTKFCAYFPYQKILIYKGIKDRCLTATGQFKKTKQTKHIAQ